MGFVTTHFAHPELLWLTLGLLVAWLAVLWARRQKRRAIERLGQAGAVHKLLLVDAGAQPAGVQPAPDDDTPAASGTRIGAALDLAGQSFDADQHRPRAVLLLSDGDDPAPEDKEWLHGVQAVRSLGVPVHVVGIGDPV